MESFALATLLMFALVAPAGSSQPPELLSVYDGWGTHYIPGFGKVSGTGSVQCGKIQVSVRTVENSEEGPQPSAERIHELRATNTATLASLAVAGNACPKPAFSAEA